MLKVPSSKGVVVHKLQTEVQTKREISNMCLDDILIFCSYLAKLKSKECLLWRRSKRDFVVFSSKKR